jgi:hypothetical protein
MKQDQVDSVLESLKTGLSLRKSCEAVSLAPSTFLGWIDADSSLGEQYARARQAGYSLLADELIAIADEKDVEVRYDGEDVKLDLSSTGVARNRLRVDTRKWMLSKMLPKIYGEKLETTVKGELKVVSATELTDDELAAIASKRSD